MRLSKTWIYFLEAIQINLSLSHAFYFDYNLIVEIKQMQ